eukprot:TRINITY_DN20691_c0_g1_i1.p1 TRINITY_DN20691_c0_g1~~TRINITY_DN20691_c0_g1_i1.p1  ORF type:complete len:453 (-),score=47.45 TRINITY_DN20691_c0_g1_i1:7-1365(-)
MVMAATAFALSFRAPPRRHVVPLFSSRLRVALRSKSSSSRESLMGRHRSSSSSTSLEMMVPADPQVSKTLSGLFLSFATSPIQIERTTSGSPGPSLDVGGLRTLLEAVGERPSAARLHRLLCDADVNRSGKIELEDFMKVWSRLLDRGNCSRDSARNRSTRLGTSCGGIFSTATGIMTAFEHLDRDCDGILSVDDLTGLLSTAGGALERAEAMRLVETALRGRGSSELDLQRFADLINDPVMSWRLRTCFRICFVVGPPGTLAQRHALCQKLSEAATLQASYISMGQELRAEARSTSSSLAKVCEKSLQAGKRVPSSKVVSLLRRRLASHPGSFVVVDGFPQSVKNYNDFVDAFGPPECVLLFEGGSTTAANGLDLSGSLIEVDADERRLDSGQQSYESIVGHLHASGVPVLPMDAAAPPDEVWKQLLKQYDVPLTRRLNLQAGTAAVARMF